MVEYELNTTYGAIADPTRRAILDRLRREPTRVTDLAALFDMSLNAVSKHVRVLERAQLLQRRVAGREHYLSLCADPLQQAGEWIEGYRNFWDRRLVALERDLTGG